MIRRYALTAALAVFAITCSVTPRIIAAGDCPACPDNGCPSNQCSACAAKARMCAASGECCEQSGDKSSQTAGAACRQEGVCDEVVDVKELHCDDACLATSGQCQTEKRVASACQAAGESASECGGKCKARLAKACSKTGQCASSACAKSGGEEHECHEALAAGCPSKSSTKCAAKSGCSKSCEKSVAGKSKQSSPCRAAEDIVKIKERLELRAGGNPCPGLNLELDFAADQDSDAEARRAQMIEVLESLDADRQAEHAELTLPGHEELSSPEEVSLGQRAFSADQAYVLRVASSSLEQTAAILEEAELDDQADLVRHLADEMRREARQASARARQEALMSVMPGARIR